MLRSTKTPQKIVLVSKICQCSGDDIGRADRLKDPRSEGADEAAPLFLVSWSLDDMTGKRESDKVERERGRVNKKRLKKVERESEGGGESVVSF